MKPKVHRSTKSKTLLSKRFELRLTDAEYKQIQALALQTHLSMSEFVRRAATRRTLPRPLAAFDLKAYQALCQMHTELRQAGNNLNQIAKVCNSSVLLGEPVVVNRTLLERTQQLLQENQTLIETLASAIAQSTLA
ncbi:MAG: MobC family plasmid mobilization relaxosome protein [Desertifilum sp. SIO1I2]|nr:MobC family plasmid mobilization relaxosome protein [Desertifilum sp. SIO1I2]